MRDGLTSVGLEISLQINKVFWINIFGRPNEQKMTLVEGITEDSTNVAEMDLVEEKREEWRDLENKFIMVRMIHDIIRKRMAQVEEAMNNLKAPVGGVWMKKKFKAQVDNVSQRWSTQAERAQAERDLAEKDLAEKDLVERAQEEKDLAEMAQEERAQEEKDLAEKDLTERDLTGMDLAEKDLAEKDQVERAQEEKDQEEMAQEEKDLA